MALRKPPTKGEIRRKKAEEVALYPFDWLEERSGLIGGVSYFLFRKVPGDINWMQTLGSAALTAFLVQAITGVILAMYYVPSSATDPATGKPVAWESIDNITNHLFMGWLVRGMHRWGASVFIILMFLHMGRVFLFGAYKYPRELNWIIGVLILATGMMEGFTGYLLPWDQTAYWASVVGINLNGTAPFLGPWLAQFLRSGQDITGATLTRFYSLHMLVIPGGLMALIGLHLYLVIRLGVTSPPWSKEAAGERLGRPVVERPRGADAAGCARRGRTGLMAVSPKEKPSRLELNRAGFAKYKDDVKKRGKPFFPYAMFHDTVMSLVVVLVIIGLAVIWKWTAYGPHHNCADSGILGPCMGAPADPGTTSFVPRPDWYFYFLFYLLRIFKWPESVFLGTVGIPNICLVLLIMLPFMDRRRTRKISQRPVAMVAGVLVILSMAILDLEGRDGEGSARVGDQAGRAELDHEGASGGLSEPGGGHCRREAVRCGRLHRVPHVQRRRQLEPRRARPDRDRLAEPRHRHADQAPHGSELGARPARRCRRSRRSAQKRLKQLAYFLEASKGGK